jgi:hypothetical protein
MPAALMPMPCWPRLWRLAGDDAGAVVLDCDAEAGLGELADLDADVRQDAGLLGRVERIVDALLHRRQDRLRGIVEAEQVSVLGEELRDGDVALLLRELDGGRALARGRATARAARRLRRGRPALRSRLGRRVARVSRARHRILPAPRLRFGALAPRGSRARDQLELGGRPPLRHASPPTGFPRRAAVRVRRGRCVPHAPEARKRRSRAQL